jgi:hypothetical protein
MDIGEANRRSVAVIVGNHLQRVNRILLSTGADEVSW